MPRRVFDLEAEARIVTQISLVDGKRHVAPPRDIISRVYKLGLIFIGSGLGGVARYAFAGLAQRLNPHAGFPIGTLLVNVTGCLAIGFLSAALAGRSLMREEYRLAILVGVLGGYTTFSTFGWETFALLNGGQFARAAMNVLLSVFGCLIAVWAGYRGAQFCLGA